MVEDQSGKRKEDRVKVQVVMHAEINALIAVNEDKENIGH